MKLIKNIGLIVFVFAVCLFTGLIFTGEFKLTQEVVNEVVKGKSDFGKNKVMLERFQKELMGKSYGSSFALSWDLRKIYKEEDARVIASATELSTKAWELSQEEGKKEESEAATSKANAMWGQKIGESPHKFAYPFIKAAAIGMIPNNKGLFFFLTFGLGMIGGIMYILPNVVLLGSPGIKNNGLFFEPASSRGWVGILVFIWLVVFYVFLYISPDYISNWILIVDPISYLTNGGPASQWFLYGLLYCVVMLVMGIRMYIKYRHNKYQMVRTTVVLFFQVAFAFAIPQLLAFFNKPSMDFKSAWPLDYSFFYKQHLDDLIASGNLGIFMIGWGILLTLIIVPVFSYFFGKRWYCSWVCGCGGLAETLGDPYRQLSNKKTWSWKLERYLIHGVLLFAIGTTGLVLYSYFTEQNEILFLNKDTVKSSYGFLIGTIFSGVIGTGFYPVLGNRVWCRFGCPLAAYMGLIQRFKSRFRITVNGGQCISCGNCSTYCEQGIDVRAYAQKGQNVVRASCVGCGICAAVCPRGVLKLENGPEEERVRTAPVLIGADIPFLDR